MSAYSTLHLHIHECRQCQPHGLCGRSGRRWRPPRTRCTSGWICWMPRPPPSSTSPSSSRLLRFSAQPSSQASWLLNRAAGVLNRSLALQPDSVLFQLQNAPAAAEKIDSMA